MPFLPGLSKYLTGESLKLPSVATWWCGQPYALDWVLDHLEHVVVKPAFPSRGMEPVFGARLEQAEKGKLAAQLSARPHEYVAQEQVDLSKAPVWDNGLLQARSVVLRTYVLNTGNGWTAIPGGLVRVAGLEDPSSPGVFAVPAALHGDDRSSRPGDAHQSSGNGGPPVAGIQHVGSQHHAPRLKECRCPRPAHWTELTCSCATYSCGWARSCAASFRFFGACSSPAPKTGSMPREGKAGFTTTWIEMIEHPVQRVRLPAPPGRNRWQLQILSRHVPRKAGKKWHDCGSLNDPAAQRIGHAYVSSDDGADQAGHSRGENRCVIPEDRKSYRPRGAE